MATQTAPEIHAGLLALLGGVLTTAVFTIGFVSHRSHTALLHARDLLRRSAGNACADSHVSARNPAPESWEIQDRNDDVVQACEMVEHAQSYLVLVVNSAIAVLSALAVGLAWLDDIEPEDVVTLVGFILLLAAIIALGLHDHLRVRSVLNRDPRVSASGALKSPRETFQGERSAVREQWSTLRRKPADLPDDAGGRDP